MGGMPANLTWADIAIRLVLTAVAGGLIGLNREPGHAAGIRTLMLLSLASALTMIEVNLLLPTAGRAADSFVNFDPMRLPLGLLSGMGFLGAAAIIHRGSLIMGATTAATLWFATVMGLCFGGGQIGLGLLALALGMVVLWGLKWVKLLIPEEYRVVLSVADENGALDEPELMRRLGEDGFSITDRRFAFLDEGRKRDLRYELKWRGRPKQGGAVPAWLEQVARRPGVTKVAWSPHSTIVD
ncbi:putative Mg2+ transporter-C (MgtC) family protein [Faunimonas pinastri]|uniref:Protein MgtC n=1 Tax=Faunimonas pinastri TaxID=1855383 RepID=A0A1H9FX24_9HYPH|nr:MgtC/SapB family protein [Faunimonas pinastri]SEQ42387.1 putative Mg2+ transporter-C (MgtC) family protein [Faunimonas pinastri]